MSRNDKNFQTLLKNINTRFDWALNNERYTYKISVHFYSQKVLRKKIIFFN